MKVELFKGRVSPSTYMGAVADGSTVAAVVREIKRAGRKPRYEYRSLNKKHGAIHHISIH